MTRIGKKILKIAPSTMAGLLVRIRVIETHDQILDGEPGHLADLIIVSGDPLKDIDDAAKVECVMKNGQLQSAATVMAPFARSTIGAAICPSPR